MLATSEREREMTQISSCAAILKAVRANVPVIEVLMGSVVVGLNIGGHVVRHWQGWYDEAKIDAAVEKGH
jgi:hypothetical protein